MLSVDGALTVLVSINVERVTDANVFVTVAVPVIVDGGANADVAPNIADGAAIADVETLFGVVTASEPQSINSEPESGTRIVLKAVGHSKKRRRGRTY